MIFVTPGPALKRRENSKPNRRDTLSKPSWGQEFRQIFFYTAARSCPVRSIPRLELKKEKENTRGIKKLSLALKRPLCIMRQILRMGEMTFVKTFFVFKAPFFRMNGGQKETVSSPLFSQTVFLPSLSKRLLFNGARRFFFQRKNIRRGQPLLYRFSTLVFNLQPSIKDFLK